jgi:hypothetical protein
VASRPLKGIGDGLDLGAGSIHGQGRGRLDGLGDIDRSPGFAVLATALGRTISTDAEALMRGPFALGDAGELARVLEAGGLYDCTIRAETGTCAIRLGGDVRP